MPARVSIVRCATYDLSSVRESLARALEPLQGMGAFVRPGMQVLLKPNLLTGAPPERAVTTHPAVLRAVAESVLAAGGKPSVGDSPSLQSLESAAEGAGILPVCRELGIPLISFDHPCSVPAGDGAPYSSVVLDRAVLEADVVINLPKLKSHCQTVLTGAVKNLFGCVTGKRKILWHLRAGDREGGARFAAQLIENVRQIRPALTVMDAVIGMEGNGPMRGDPRAVGLLLASDDPVACDREAADLIGWDPEGIPVLQAARFLGVGEPDLGYITLHGEPLAGARVPAFRRAVPVPVSFNPAKLAWGAARRKLRELLSDKN